MLVINKAIATLLKGERSTMTSSGHCLTRLNLSNLFNDFDF